MMRRAVAVLGLMPGIALAGCSAASGPPDLTLAQVNTERPVSTAPLTAPVPPVAAAGKFDSESFYQVLVAEMAGRRGDFALALGNYLEVASRTREPEVAERAVRIAVFAHDETRALQAAQLWAQTASPNYDARQVLGVLLVRAGKLDEATSVFVTLAKERASDDPALFARLSNMLAREKSRTQSVTAMQALTAEFPASAEAQLALAQLLFRFGELDQALAVIEKVIVLTPDDDKVAVFKAQVLQRQDKRPEAIEVLAAFLAAHDTGASAARMAYARLLVDAQRYDEALIQFRLLSTETPDDPDVAYALGLLQLQTRDLDAAEAQFRKLIDIPERRSTAWFYLGQIAEAREDTDAALAAYRKVEEGDHQLNAQIRAAVLMSDSGDLAGARRLLQSQHGDDMAQSIRLYRAEAEMLGRKDMLEDALAVYDQGLKEFPQDNGLLYARAMLSVRLDRIDSVEADLRDILSREPDNAEALNALGYTLADRTKRYEEAYELIKRAHALKPDDHYVVDSMGWVLYRLGRYEEAVQQLRRAMELKSDPEVAAHLGEVLWVMGDKAAARDVWDEALKAQPEDGRLLEVLKRFGL